MGQRVLFCDDDPDIREIVAISLGLDADLEVRGCESATQLVAIAAEWQPALILLDVMMPGIDGPTALGMLRRNEAVAPVSVVFMTARTQAFECERLKALGAAGMIPKPFDPMLLASQVRDYLSRAAPRR